MNKETEIILEHVRQGHHFLLSGGAGSGKTYTLVEVTKELIEKYPSAKIACITYTNAAVMVIEQRVNSSHLVVSTIHDFLWDNIKNYQEELKDTVLELGRKGDLKFPDGTNFDTFFAEQEEPVSEIKYMEFLRLKKGHISHDEVLVVAEYMFAKYPKICDILASKYPYILVDEYQDTSPLVMKILLEHVAKSKNRMVCGFFGDAMQAIYEDGVGNLNEYLKRGGEDYVYEVKKPNNWRNPKCIIRISNAIRTDGIVQLASDEKKGEGQALFLYSDGQKSIEEIRNYLKTECSWPIPITKELNLTHNLIAGKAGFKTLMDIYSNNQILKYAKKIADFIAKNNIEQDFSDYTFGKVLALLQDRNGCDNKGIEPTKGQEDFFTKYPKMWENAQNASFSEICNAHAGQDSLIDNANLQEEARSQTGSRMSYLIKHLYKIENLISLYRDDNIIEFLRRTGKKIVTGKDKRQMKDAISRLCEIDGKTIADVIRIADEEGICIIDDKLEAYKERQPFIYSQVEKVSYQEFRNLYNYREGNTPFSTQHKVKGDEFDNVLVILDNGKWNNYNFKYFFEDTTGKENIINRTRKLFYVCCTRAMEKLAVFFPQPSEGVLKKAIKLFGEENVLKI